MKLHDYSWLAAQAGVVPGLLILQFVSPRLMAACQRLAHTSGAKLGSPALLETFSLVAMLAGLASLVGMTVLAVESGLVWVALPGLAGFIMLEYLAIVATNPEALDLAVEPDVAPGDEAIGILSFLVMALARLAPVLWGVGVLWGAAELILAAVSLLARAPSLWPTHVWVGPVIGLLVLAPLWVYLKLLVYQLLVALVRAVMATPERLAAIAERE